MEVCCTGPIYHIKLTPDRYKEEDDDEMYKSNRTVSKIGL